MKQHSLSKSSFIRGVQCPKSLYLYKNFYSLRDRLSPETQSKFSRGHNVGLLAQQLFPDGINMKPFSPQQYARAVERTKELILKDTNTIYEAAFSFNDVTVYLDILNFENGSWKAYEVKSSIEVSEIYKMDASLQYYVISNSGIDLASFNIIYINKDYVRGENLDIKKYFLFRDVTEIAILNQSYVQTKVDEFKSLLADKKIPDIGIGTHCHDPYDCDFIGHCWKEIPKQKSVFSLPAFSMSEKFSFYNKGKLMLDDFSDTADCNEIQRIQIDSCIKDEEYIDKEKFENYFSKIKFPVLIAHLQSNRPAVPRRKNTRPYQPVPYLMHASRIDIEGSEIKSSMFFQEDTTRNSSEFYQSVLEIFEESATIVVFRRNHFIDSVYTMVNDGFIEMNTFEKLAERTIGLSDVFSSDFYFNPALSDSPDLHNISRSIFKIRISRKLISSDVVASDVYDSLQSETDMFHIVESKERLNEYAGFNLEAMKRMFLFLWKKLPEDKA